MRCSIPAVVLLTCVYAPVAHAADRWVMQPSPQPLTKLWNKVQNGKGRFLSSSGLSWPDGRQSVALYFEIEGRLWRCVENFTARMEWTGTTCHRLEQK